MERLLDEPAGMDCSLGCVRGVVVVLLLGRAVLGTVLVITVVPEGRVVVVVPVGRVVEFVGRVVVLAGLVVVLEGVTTVRVTVLGRV